MLVNKFFDFVKFFNPWYLFARTPSPLSRNFLIAWIAGSAILAAIGVAFKIYAKKNRSLPSPLARWWRRLGTSLVVAAFLSAILLFFRYERSPFLSARVLMLIWLMVLAVDLGRQIWIRRARLPEVIDEEERQRRLRRYLP